MLLASIGHARRGDRGGRPPLLKLLALSRRYRLANAGVPCAPVVEANGDFRGTVTTEMLPMADDEERLAPHADAATPGGCE